MKQVEIKELALGDLKDRIIEETVLLKKLKMNNSVTTIENPGKIKMSRRTIARLKTELRKRELNPQTK